MNVELIKSKMKENKITQKQLSEKTGVPIQTIKYIFTGRTKYPRIDTVEAIEKALGIDAELVLTDKQTRLLKAFKCLIPPMQDYIVSMVEKLTEQPQNVVKGENNIIC